MSTTNTHPAKTMAELLASHKTSVVHLKKGEIVKGVISKMTASEMFIDLQTKTEAFVLEHDKRLFKQLQSFLHIGDTVTATVISPESEKGYPVVSLRHFLEDKIWGELSSIEKLHKKIDVLVREATKGGYIVTTTAHDIQGFLPHSHVSHTVSSENIVGRRIPVMILELDRENKKIVFSHKGIITHDEFKEAVKGMTKGGKRAVIVTGITSFGLFVTIPVSENLSIDGLIHISELSWDKISDINTRFKVGEKLEAVIIDIDFENRRIELSLKQLIEDPFEKIAKEFPLDKKVKGTIREITDEGITVDLGLIDGQSAEGFIKSEKIPPNTQYEKGQTIQVMITQLDSKKRKIMLVPVLLEKPIGYR